MTTIGENLRHLREQADMSRAELAAQVDLNVAQIGAYETNKDRASVKRIARLAEALGVEIADFFVGVTPEDVPTPRERRRGEA